MLPAQFIRGGNKHFQRCVTCARAHSREAGVDSVAALFHRRDRVRHAKTQVMVSVHAGLRFWFQLCFQGAETVTDIAHVHRTARIHHINTGRTVAFHQLCLLCEILRRGHMAHHQKTNGVHSELAGILNMLGGNISFGTVRCHTNHPRASLPGIFQIVNSADSWQQQRRDFGVLHHIRRRFNPFKVAMCAETIVKAGTLQTVAVGHFNRIHVGIVQCFGNLANVFQRILMTNGVHTVTQRDVRNIKFFTVHAASPALRASDWAIFSAVASALEVIMSRLPA